MTSDKNIIENYIKILRAKPNLTQDDLARKLSVKCTTPSKIESEVVTKPTAQTIAKISKELDVYIENLLK